ncbi:DUF418 domain-containing protein [Macrococcus brunensis]|uniref:DUF418 domain-containing protein n=1 Tax=Macrococcus brunensis TaxID=198483 RepID=A0A4R6BBP2_9STAP|nr:DUF418 domain-containing protein [Macrococcus brunensis]TDL95236.1 DUF418 domain-containing protein [Macrococcus brunensis]
MKERIISIDIIRGISLIGILFMNALGFHYANVYNAPKEIYRDPLSQWIYDINVVFIHNSFYPIFAFLFGMGMAIMFRNIKQRGQNPSPILLRRFIAMLVFGLVHGFLLFYGDILQTYATLALLCIPFLFAKPIVSLIVAVVQFSFMAFITLLTSIFMSDIPLADTSDKMLTKAINQSDIMGIIKWNALQFTELATPLSVFNIIDAVLMIMPFILFGMWCFRTNVFYKLKIFRKATVISIMVTVSSGVMIKIFALKGHYEVVYVGGTILAAAYVMTLVLLCSHSVWLKFLMPFQALGKLAFSAYIVQSLILFLIFYVFRLYNSLHIITLHLLLAAIALLLLWLSNLYLKHYKMGPLEWLWRKVTYLK